MRLRRCTRTEQETNGTSVDPRVADAATALAHARQLAGEQAYDEAIDLLAAAFRRFDEDELAIALVDLRVEAHRGDSTRATPRGGTRTTTTGWYRPVAFVHKDGGVWLADSPRATAGFFDQLTACGVIGAISGHFGERPFISVQKSTLRHTTTDKRNVSWHQDGAFIGEQVRTMNVWLALSRCGGDHPSPGLEVAPFRVPHVLPTGETLSLNAVSRKLVAEVTAELPVVVPEFEPGDALLFDELFLYRTYVTPQMTEDRYTIECWFFAPSHSSSEYLPLVV